MRLRTIKSVEEYLTGVLAQTEALKASIPKMREGEEKKSAQHQLACYIEFAAELEDNRRRILARMARKESK